MKDAKFFEIVGNASTTSFLKGRRIGHAVNAVAWLCAKTDNILLTLESNNSRVRGTPTLSMTRAEYAEFCERKDRVLFVRGIELFGAEVAL